jgi:hypothetical protein
MGLLRITAAPEPDRFKQLSPVPPLSNDRDALRQYEVTALRPTTSGQASAAGVNIDKGSN